MDREAGRRRALSRRARLILIASLVLVVVAPGVAWAHAFLVSSTPSAGERLSSSPPSIVLRFSEPVAGGERVVLRTAEGTPVSTGAPRLPQGSSIVEVPLPGLKDGIYAVSWQVVGTDGDLTAGEFAFAIGPGGSIPSQRTLSGPIDWPQAVTTWALLLGLLIAVGGLFSERLIWSRVGRERDLDVPSLPVGWLLVLALLGAGLQFALFAHRVFASGSSAQGWRSLLSSRPGVLGLAEALLVGYGLWLAIVPVPWARRWALVPLGLAVTAAALRGHEGATSAWWAGPANILHLLAVAFWAGALAHLVLVTWRLRAKAPVSALLEGVRVYASFALVAVLVVLLSGAILALSQFASLLEVLDTTYGRTLLIKAAVAGVALGLAFVARTRALPANPHPRMRLLRGLVRAESAFVVAAVAVAAVLGNAPTPRSATPTAFALGPPPLQGQVLRLAGLSGSLAVFLAAAPGRLQVQAIGPSGNPAPGTDIRIVGRAPDGSELAISPRSCGPGCVTTGFTWPQGTTTLTVNTSSTRWGRGLLRFPVPWPPLPQNRLLLSGVLRAMRAQASFTLTERVSSGFGATGSHRFAIDGPKFVSLEPYAGDAVTDVRSLPATGSTSLVLFLPGSWIWVRLDLDASDRLTHETIVDPGHLIERTFSYQGSG